MTDSTNEVTASFERADAHLKSQGWREDDGPIGYAGVRALLASYETVVRLTHAGSSQPADQAVERAREAECAALLAAYLRKEIGVLMHQAEHWAANGKPLAVHHRLMKADDYFRSLY